MKRALVKDSVKQIKNTLKRFISILMMAFLGVGFFAGIKATSPDMIDTIDRYYKEQNIYDLEIVSTLGLTNDDLNEIAKIDGIDQVEGTYEKDAIIENDNEEIVVKLLCANNINVPIVLEGNLPINEDECVVEDSFLKTKNKKIGDYIDLKVEDSTNDNGDKVNYLKQNKLKIVGTVKSPLYISRNRGTSNLGSGSVDYFMYISDKNINANDIYTRIYAKVKNANEYTTSTDEYENYIDNITDNVEKIKDQREQARYNQLITSATNKLNDAEQTFNEEKQNGQTKIDDAEKELTDGKKKIESAEAKISKNEKEAEYKFSSAEKQIKSAKEEISKSENELSSKEKEVNSKIEEYEKQKNDLNTKLNDVNSGIDKINANYKNIIESLKNNNLPADQRKQLEQTKSSLEQQLNELNKNKNELESGIKSIESGISTAKSEIEKAKNQISTGKKELQKQENTLNASKKEAQTKIENAKKELEQSKEKIKNGEEELEKSKNEYNQKINDAEKELIDAKSKIADIESPKWYIFDRYNNDGYNSYIQDTHSIKNLGNVFPIVFFIVATLISLNSMTRMVEEQRTQIGTLKALGYNKFQIISKYVIYATLATVIGGILGMCVGFVLIPTIIFKMYQMMYQISGFKAEFNMFYGMLGLGLISICIIGATIYSALKELGNTPATLMRPKSPKIGKRVLLEHIPFIWKRLSFTRKVTVRNIFRYKKRFLMTIIGILGCTALIVTGFGLKNTIKSIIPLEYENVFNYDMQITLKSGNDENQKDKYIQELKNKDEIEKVVATYMTSVTAQKDDKSESLIMIVPDDENKLEGLINIKDVKTKSQVSLKENEICITDKVAQLLNVKQGDTVKIKDLDDNEIDVKVSNIVENYVYHYAYMSKQTYQNLFKKDYSTNILFTKNKELSEEKINELSKAIMNDNEVSGVSVISNLTSQIDNMMSSLNYVVIILIVSAGLLAFVVLYNLQNVNISERIRELATIKVLGFYDKEVYSYVARETILLTIIGTILGLIGGYFLNAFILKTCEINMLRFKPTIEPISYIYAIVLTTGFSIIVNIATYFALKKIDMIESLKSVE